MRVWIALVLVCLVSGPALACSFCSDGFTRRQPLREKFADAKIVVAGVLKNPIARDDGTGTTEFHITHVLKTDAALGKTAVLTIPRYLPIVADTPPDYVFFCSIVDGRIEPVDGIAGGKAVRDYLTGVAKIDAKTPAGTRIGYFFRLLDAADPTVSADAFLELARTTDADLVKAKASLDPAKIRKWIVDPKVPDERIGVLGLLLGLSGNGADANWLAGALTTAAPSDRVASNLGGLLTGLILLNPEQGWKLAGDLLASPTRPFSDKLNVISAIRFFQATRPKESKDHIVACLRALIANRDLADLAIDDLRRWGWWDLTPTILDAFAKPTHAAPVIRRGIVRYALQCPDDKAKAFVAGLRTTEPALVKKVEDGLKLYEKK
ncbi:hypothetical protein [Limnoglobus roseus]|uniref:RES domain-containing protein n=1 Tax=Limnoglobus roseus TaxID=2598579 RepID=A0A5C1ALE6_9BACT|nr:hypothetical protein [Limnoglobus roseus]QEL19395.1 RES domain-containing protein [Limnoglobus roseus]